MWGGTDGGTPEVTLETSMGAITVEMYYKHAPKTCRNFVELARRGYYDNVIFHRIIKDFIVQGGDPTGTGRGGESIYGAKFEDEIKSELKHTGAGILSMANAGPNTNGSQFFITLAPCQSLDGKHTIFGRVCRGMEIVKRLGSVQTDKNDRFNGPGSGAMRGKRLRNGLLIPTVVLGGLDVLRAPAPPAFWPPPPAGASPPARLPGLVVPATALLCGLYGRHDVLWRHLVSIVGVLGRLGTDSRRDALRRHLVPIEVDDEDLLDRRADDDSLPKLLNVD
ncbi:hypothetical protein C2845_PM13G25910 [Panicum miliaceum]|uniref:Peptidyl-prolyl cis-trans isomerase n=1 Tax=Panicum miliaceum TaxID=4540 RepID=A0A3L6RFC7_PANMI|nr:hypothetical protein C2845_PM13G25910 [Panicum miliaceum]